MKSSNTTIIYIYKFKPSSITPIENMGVFKYPPKYKNPNWSPYSKKKELWAKYGKKSSPTNNAQKSNIKTSNNRKIKK